MGKIWSPYKPDIHASVVAEIRPFLFLGRGVRVTDEQIWDAWVEARGHRKYDSQWDWPERVETTAYILQDNRAKAKRAKARRKRKRRN